MSEDAISKVKDDMIKHAKRYFKNIVWHSPVQSAKTGLSMGFNTHFPLSDLFISQEAFDAFLREVDKRDPSLSMITSCLCEFYQRFSVNKFAPFYIKTKGSNQNIGQCDFLTYNLIFEGER